MEYSNIYTKEYVDDNLREYIHHKDNGTCQKCKKVGVWLRFGKRYFACEKGWSRVTEGMTGDTERIWVRFHVDHIIPEVMGGTLDEDNLRLLCPKCNLSRKKYELEETNEVV